MSIDPVVHVAALKASEEYFDRSTRCLTEEDSSFAHHRGALSVYSRLRGYAPAMPYMET